MAKTADPSSNRYMGEYNYLAERLVNGKEAVDMIAEFYEKLAYIEYQYAKSIAQLCNSRHGKLQKLFTDKPSEYFRPLQSVWSAVLEDLSTYSESHLNVAYTLQREVKPALTSFSQDELTKQIEVTMHGKKVIAGLKEDHTKLAMERRKVYKTILSESAEEMKEIKDDVTDNQTTKQLQKLWIRSKDSHAHAYNVTIPSILEDVNKTSVKRVELVCQSVGHFTSLMTSAASTFSTTASTLLAAQTASQTVKYEMECASPPPPGELQLNMSRSDMMEYCQNPAKKFLNNIQEMVFPANVGSIFVNPIKSETENPLKDISQKMATMWSNIRTRTLSGNLVESAQDDNISNDDVLLDPEDEQILDVGVVRGTLALEDDESLFEAKESSEESVNQPITQETDETEKRNLEREAEQTDNLTRDNMLISISNDPDSAEEYVVVNE